MTTSIRADAALTSPPSSLSQEARDFIAQSSSADWLTSDLSAGSADLAQLRRENTDIGRAGWEAHARAECPVLVEDDAVGGVPVQWVVPAEVRAADQQHGETVVLFLFGGAFVVGSPEDDLSMTARLAHSTHLRVCVPRYRLAPEHPFPAASADVSAVFRGFGGGIGGVLLVGESAGGNLALNLLLDVLADAPGEAELPTIRAVALLSPWIDLTHSGASHAGNQGLDPTLSVPHFLGPASRAYAAGAASSAAVSPLFRGMPSQVPPTVISSASRDLLLSDAERLAAKLRAAAPADGSVVDLRVAHGLWHVYEWYPQLPEAAESLRGIADFLLEHAFGE
ncbi:Esterase [Diplonema papillatum]|nr:Esterase [Diplonema papillatum]KAJ9457499.1 Esterase [Diplonema papillatum]